MPSSPPSSPGFNAYAQPPKIRHSYIHQAVLEDPETGFSNDPKKRQLAGEKRRLIEVDPNGTLKANKKILKDKYDNQKLEILGKRKRKSKRWTHNIDPDVISDNLKSQFNDTSCLPSTSLLKAVYTHTANYYNNEGVLGSSKDGESSSNGAKKQNMFEAFDSTALVCLSLLYEEIEASNNRDEENISDEEVGRSDDDTNTKDRSPSPASENSIAGSPEPKLQPPKLKNEFNSVSEEDLESDNNSIGDEKNEKHGKKQSKIFDQESDQDSDHGSDIGNFDSDFDDKYDDNEKTDEKYEDDSDDDKDDESVHSFRSSASP